MTALEGAFLGVSVHLTDGRARARGEGGQWADGVGVGGEVESASTPFATIRRRFRKQCFRPTIRVAVSEMGTQSQHKRATLFLAGPRSSFESRQNPEQNIIIFSHLEVFEDFNQSFIFDPVALNDPNVGIQLPVTLRVLRFADGLAQLFQDRQIDLSTMRWGAWRD